MSETFTRESNLHLKSLQEVASLVPEIAHNFNTIAAEGSHLVAEYDIEPTFFDEPVNTMLFAGLARRSLSSRPENGGNDSDRAFVDAASKMMFMGHSSRKQEFMHELGEGDTLPESEFIRIYNRLTNVQVTTELNAAFNNGLLNDVKVKLGVTDDNEMPFTLHVLNVGAESEFAGLEPTDSGDKDLFNTWKADLMGNNQYFMNLTGNVGVIPAAQTTHMDDGSKHMLIPLPVAEKILHPELVDESVYDEIRRKRDLGIIKHEYVHTQRPTIHSHVGYALEERRADYLAGTQSYVDLMWFSNDLKVVTGVSLSTVFDSQKDGAGQTELYADFINSLGLDNVLQFALTMPKAYDSPERITQDIVANYIGGYDGILSRLYADIMDNPEQAEEFSDRLDEYAGKLMTMFTDQEKLSFVLSQRKRLGLEFMNSLIIERTQKLSESVQL